MLSFKSKYNSKKVTKTKNNTVNPICQVGRGLGGEDMKILPLLIIHG